MSYFKTTRGWQDSEFFGDNIEFSERDAWIWMIGEAQWKDGHVRVLGKRVFLKRGQFSSSIRFMAGKFGWSKDRVSRFLKRAEIWGMIASESATGQKVITICNYEKYQSVDQDGKDTNKDSNKDAPKDTSKDKLEEGKEGKEVKEVEAPEKSALKIWNEICGDVLAKPRSLTTTRKSKILARVKDLGGLEGWRNYCGRIRGSPFCCGNNDRGWKADIDFALSEEKMNRVLEGKYDETTGRNNGRSGQTRGDKLDDILEQHLASKGIAYSGGGSPNLGDNPPVLRSLQHLRQGPVSAEEHAPGIRGSAGSAPNGQDHGGIQGMAENPISYADTGRHPENPELGPVAEKR